MTLLSMLLVATLPSLFYHASGSFIDFRLTTEDLNHLTLECYSEVTGNVDDGATIEFFNTPSEDADPHGNLLSGPNGATFDVTPDNEAFFRCTSSDGTVRSDFVAIAAVPPDFSMEPARTMNVFGDANAELVCPIMLGRLFNHLDPYIFSWEQVGSRGFAVPVDSSLYSNKNRVLTILIDNTTRSNQYRCILQLRRCDITRSGAPRCPVMTHEGPCVQFEVFETSRIIVRPDLQRISADEIASFVCVGFGSFINISWEYGEVCGAESCNGAVIPSETVRGDDRNRRIESTLMINASMLQFPPTVGYSAVVQCILHQIVPPALNLQGVDKTFAATLMVTDMENPDIPVVENPMVTDIPVVENPMVTDIPVVENPKSQGRITTCFCQHPPGIQGICTENNTCSDVRTTYCFFQRKLIDGNEQLQYGCHAQVGGFSGRFCNISSETVHRICCGGSDLCNQNLFIEPLLNSTSTSLPIPGTSVTTGTSSARRVSAPGNILAILLIFIKMLLG